MPMLKFPDTWDAQVKTTSFGDKLNMIFAALHFALQAAIRTICVPSLELNSIYGLPLYEGHFNWNCTFLPIMFVIRLELQRQRRNILLDFFGFLSRNNILSSVVRHKRRLVCTTQRLITVCGSICDNYLSSSCSAAQSHTIQAIPWLLYQHFKKF